MPTPTPKKAGSLVTTIKDNAISVAVKVVLGLVLLVTSHTLGSKTSAYFNRLNKERKTSTVTLIALGKVAYLTILSLGILLILRLFGVEIASIVAILTAVGFILGMSLQGTLSDIASGFMLAIFQTYNIGDVIQVQNNSEAVVLGKVIEFRMVNTIVEDMYSGVLVTIPNRKIQESVIMNYTSKNTHMVIVDILASNRENKDFAAIVASLNEHIQDPSAFPDIERGVGAKARAFVYDMSEVGTKIRVVAPISSDSSTLLLKRSNIKNAIRKHLDVLKVMLVDPF